jgi:hypothetical protein
MSPPVTEASHRLGERAVVFMRGHPALQGFVGELRRRDLPRRRHPSYAASIFCRFKDFHLTDPWAPAGITKFSEGLCLSGPQQTRAELDTRPSAHVTLLMFGAPLYPPSERCTSNPMRSPAAIRDFVRRATRA